MKLGKFAIEFDEKRADSYRGKEASIRRAVRKPVL